MKVANEINRRNIQVQNLEFQIDQDLYNFYILGQLNPVNESHTV